MNLIERRHRFKWLGWALFVVLAAGCLLVAIFFTHNTSAPAPTPETAVVKPAPLPKTISSNVLFLGNSFWGRYINDWSMASPLKTAYPFSRLNEFHRDQYDAWISGLECPTKAGVNMTSAQMEVALQFNCSPEYLPEAAKWYTAFSLANNHTDNQGVDGFAETQQQLDKNGIQYFGNYDPNVLGDVCEVIALPASIINADNSKTKGDLPIALCGFHGVFQIPSAASVAQMKKYSSYMPVIAMPHMGTEYRAAADSLKTNFYRELIDGGADMVIGDHPHWIQNTESYNGHLIVYSMGNFMFDQQDTPEVVRSAGINVVMKTDEKNSDMMKKWLELGKTCQQYKDSCLEQAIRQNLTKLNIDYQFGVVGTNDSGKITKPATSAQQVDILKRLNWPSTMNKLQSPYSSL